MFMGTDVIFSAMYFETLRYTVPVVMLRTVSWQVGG